MATCMGITYPAMPDGTVEQALISFFLYNNVFYYFSSTFKSEDYDSILEDANQFFNSIHILK
ncbi:MAG TPA: hypothetical protein DDX92_03160 [Flavobacteriales bacterium]|jgi:hypothetical protein|nr:hypothetical protein [Flavobacteriales bacterium]